MSAAPARRNLGIVPAEPVNGERLAPHNIEAEQAVISSMVLDDAVIPGILAMLRPDHFYRDGNRAAFEAIVRLCEQGKPVDPLLLRDELERVDRIALGEADLSTIIGEGAPSAVNANYYAGLVRSAAVRRGIIEACNRGLDGAYAAVEPAETILGRIVRELDCCRESLATLGADGYATLADAERIIGDTEYLWRLWIPRGTLTGVYALPGIGKSRFVMDLAARIYRDGTMPDGSPSGYPAGTPTIWYMFDRSWRSAIRNARAFGLPREAIILPGGRDDPLRIPSLDDPRAMPRLEELIDRHKPAFVALDTTTYSTAANTAKSNETMLAFDPILDVLARTRTAGLGITHENSAGGVLNRRLEERFRVAIRLEKPDPNNDKLKLWVPKTEDDKPEPMGLIINGSTLKYDHAPPPPAEEGHRGPAPKKTTDFAEWLWTYLGPGPAPIVEIVDAARAAKLLKSPAPDCPKPSLASLYNARERIPRLRPGKVVGEFTRTISGGKGLKHWEILDAPPAEEEAAS